MQELFSGILNMKSTEFTRSQLIKMVNVIQIQNTHTQNYMKYEFVLCIVLL